MRAPRFWQRRGDWRARLLAPLGWVFGAITARRMSKRGLKLPVPVICVGNFTAGGAGKTPLVLALARLLLARGETVFILSRGYRGRGGAVRAVVLGVDDAASVGDEPLLLAAVAPTIVGANRVASARLALACGASVIVMDDGLQNPSLAKSFSFAVIDGAAGLGNGLCLPAGPLRAPLAAQLPSVDAVIVIGEGAVVPGLGEKPLLRAHLQPDMAVIAALRGKKLLAFAGIGRPEKFFATLRRYGLPPIATRAYGDHHAYTQTEIADLEGEAASQAACLVTTQKDFVRLAARQRDAITAVPVVLAFEDEQRFVAIIAAAMDK